MSLEPTATLLLAARVGVTLCGIAGYALGRLLPDEAAIREMLRALPDLLLDIRAVAAWDFSPLNERRRTIR